MGTEWNRMDERRAETKSVFPVPATAEALSEMSREDLAARCLALQKVCARLDDDYKFLAWELKESSDNMVRFARVAQMAHSLNASDIDTIADFAISELPHYLNCSFSAFYLYDQAEGRFSLYRSAGRETCDETDESDPVNKRFLLRLFSSTGGPFVIKSAPGGYRIEPDAPENQILECSSRLERCLGGTAMVFPLAIHRPEVPPLLLGGLVIGDSEAPLSENEAETSLMFVDLLSSSLHNAKLVRQLNEMASTDPLTKLYNRRYFLDEMEKAMAQALRNFHPLSIAMLDIDFFKNFNDSYGHLCGDMVLREMGALLKNSIRNNVDIPARYGGEEFVVIMPFTRIDQAVFAGERIRRMTQANTLEFDGKKLAVTCSVGIAEYIPGESCDSLVERADAALYRAKKSGRNQVRALDDEKLYARPGT